jgi:uncharacterized membrane protein YebE (DUF533 family)
MFDAKDLLGRLMQAGMSDSAPNRVSHAMGPQGLGQSGSPLGDLLGGLLGRGGGAQGGGLGGLLGQGGGGLADLARRAEEMLGAPSGSVRNTLQDKNQLAMGGLAALAGAVLGGRHGMGGAVGGGLMALLGSLAFSALKRRAAAAQADPAELAREAPLGLREPQTPEEEAELQDTALLALRAMINAAKADGAIDGGEMSRIMGKLHESGTDSEARNFVMGELQKPLDLDTLVRGVKSQEVAVQVYGASLLAIEVDTPAERDYLQRLAKGLGLDGETVERVHASLGLGKAA